MNHATKDILSRGITAHQAGNFQEAKSLYKDVLLAEPSNSDANHNLGLLAISDNQTKTALPLFKNALESNPEIEQFWLSYVDALVKGCQFDTAEQIALSFTQKFPECLMAWKALGVILTRTEKFTTALIANKKSFFVKSGHAFLTNINSE